MYNERDHTFVVCAFKESPYLGECVQSLVSQNIPTNILIATSTPNQHIEGIARKFAVPLFINQESLGIASDWNFAYGIAETPLVTIAHQDDVYQEEYTKSLLEGINSASNPLIFFSDYGELRNNLRITENGILKVKRALLKPLGSPVRQNSVFWRRKILSLGCAICCPSVTMVKDALPMPLFNEGLKTNLDWDAWERVSRLSGAFVYSPSVLVYHRIHEESTTTALIQDSSRAKEDLLMLNRFWPRPIAAIIGILYAQGQKSNSL
ncbi:MAG: glycosyltransferase [Eggerthellaceae bacterium]|nr:glycosyltransferase [Eggerthellaceae bacterium]